MSISDFEYPNNIGIRIRVAPLIHCIYLQCHTSIFEQIFSIVSDIIIDKTYFISMFSDLYLLFIYFLYSLCSLVIVDLYIY